MTGRGTGNGYDITKYSRDVKKNQLVISNCRWRERETETERQTDTKTDRQRERDSLTLVVYCLQVLKRLLLTILQLTISNFHIYIYKRK